MSKNYLNNISCLPPTTINFSRLECKVLIIEDSKSTNKILTQYFLHKQYQVLSVTTIKEALSVFASQHIDYVMLDINLPDGNGYELISQVSNNKTKFFVLTSDNDTQLREVMYQKGVIDFILKDKDFYKKIDQIDKTIQQLEKNRLQTILVIDDSFVVSAQIKDLFSNRNYNVLTAPSSILALEILEKNEIDLVILDLELKDSNGLDFLSQNQHIIFKKTKIPILIVSGNITPATIRDGIKAGAVEVMKKPYVIEELILKVDLWIDYHRQSNELSCQQLLLAQYKDAIDKSTIVSKTTPQGVITYVNEAFCQISGYTQEELIGHHHNMVRHPDMSKDAFEFMWYMIKELKQAWSGVVKNKKKDGTAYFVKSHIIPILDKDNNVTEYIGIRTDITEQEMIKQYFEKELHISSKSFSQAFQLQKEYEKALDTSNILSRTDTKGKITYVNQKFLDVTGYSEEELIGKSHNVIRSKDMPKEFFSKMWEKIKKGEPFEEIMKNKNKDGSDFWAATSIVPIKDENEDIVEYLAIRHDLTELFTLHEEVESAQKEIVYKMGEIGESRSKETGNHVKRVAEYSKLLATLYGLDYEEAEILLTASPMHDIGKIAIPDAVLKKPAKLDDEEWIMMKSHTTIGYDILKGSNRAILKAAAIVANEHHEKWDGSGYPRGLKGEEIHLYGRITAIADVFDALGSDRCYKRKWEDEKIFELFRSEKGKHFDPHLVDLFFEHLPRFLEIRDKFTDTVCDS